MDIVLRASAMFAVVYALLRLVGKRELAEMTPLEMVLLIVVGDLIQQGVTHNDFSITGSTLAISTFAFWILVLNWFAYRSRRAEALIDGEPSVLVRDGTVLPGVFSRNRLTMPEVESEMRLAGIARMADVAWAILETNGKISFIARGEASAPSAS